MNYHQYITLGQSGENRYLAPLVWTIINISRLVKAVKTDFSAFITIINISRLVKANYHQYITLGQSGENRYLAPLVWTIINISRLVKAVKTDSSAFSVNYHQYITLGQSGENRF